MFTIDQILYYVRSGNILGVGLNEIVTTIYVYFASTH